MDFLREFGPVLIDNGYNLVAVRYGSKAARGKDWNNNPLTKRRIAAAKDKNGVGIICGNVVAVDIDTLDATLCDEMRAFTEKRLGKTLCRFGNAPKALLLYRCDMPFPKVQSAPYLDDEGRDAKVEMLADGQQFVAYNVHPDTKQPFWWDDDFGPSLTCRDDLPLIEYEDACAIRDEFVRLVEDRGWKRKKTAQSKSRKTPPALVDDNDPFGDVAQKTEHTLEDAESLLELLPTDWRDDHDSWLQVGMALHHQFDGSAEACALWDSWSAESPKYDSEAIEYRWSSFGKGGHSPVTLRAVLRETGQVATAAALEAVAETRRRIAASADVKELYAVCKDAKAVECDRVMRETIAGSVKERLKALTGTSVSISMARDLVRPEPKTGLAAPEWLEDYVYVNGDDTFYDLTTRVKLSRTAFDNTYSRFLLTAADRLEGRTTPEILPSEIALNRVEVPVVYRTMYLPGQPALFTVSGIEYANSYTDVSVPSTKNSHSKSAMNAVAILERHFEVLFPDERTRAILISWFAHIVQTGKRSNWAVLLQGPEGDGKSFFHVLMSAVLGWENVNQIAGDTLAETYSPWAEGSQLCVIEEVRLHGANKHDVVNKMKPYISNVMSSVRRMREDVYTVPNTVNYLMLSNHKDAMPVTEGSTRVWPAFTAFQTRAEVVEFMEENPDYYDNLYAAVAEHPGALRAWFEQYELHPEFRCDRRAPFSVDMETMVDMSASETDENLAELFEDCKNPLVTRTLLSYQALQEEMMDRGMSVPPRYVLQQTLASMGFTKIGRHRVAATGRRDGTGHARHTWWTTLGKVKGLALLHSMEDADDDEDLGI